MRSLAFLCLLLAACASTTGAAKAPAPPEPPAWTPAAAAAPKPASASVLEVPDERMPDGWVRLKDEPSDDGRITAAFGHFPEDGFIQASTFDGARFNEEAAAGALAADIAAKGGKVSPVDRLNGDGHHAAFNVLVEKGGRRELHRFLFRPSGNGKASLMLIGMWPLSDSAARRADFDAIDAALILR